ncbi:MAG: hypothetical protein SXQ77_03010, partial [Halobacteria archaeon]|nr:hypothetical protein [Halobacteria archaeon]
MSAKSDPTRRVPKNIGESNEFWRGYTLDDLIVGASPFIFVVLLTAYVIPPGFRIVGYVLAVLALFLGAAIVYATPDHVTASEWLESYVHFIRRPKRIRHIRYNFDSAREQTEYPESEWYEVDERTQELIDIERIHKRQNAIERTDGYIFGGVKVEPANMA